ncbi:MAG: chemotaxis protein CheX [Acidobacteriota bacterium]
MEMQLKNHLSQSAVRTFEELAFVFTDSELDEMQLEAPFEAGATVAFDGPMRGRLSLRLYGDILETLTQNMLPDLEKSSHAMRIDTLKEITNVICGNLLPLIGGEAAIFDLHPPESDDIESPDTVPVPPATMMVVGLEGGRAELSLYLEETEVMDNGVAQ